MKQVTKLDAEGACPFVGESLRILRKEVNNEAAVLGFVGAPFTLATYIVEGGSSKSFAHIKKMAFANPEILHALLDKLADNVADYVRYQVRCCSGMFLSPELLWLHFLALFWPFFGISSLVLATSRWRLPTWRSCTRCLTSSQTCCRLRALPGACLLGLHSCCAMRSINC